MNELTRRIEAVLSERTGGAVTVEDLASLPGGACQDNLRVDLVFSSGSFEGERRMVLRSDAEASLPGSIDRRREFEVIGAAVEAGVRTPAAHFLSEGLVRPGASAYFLDWIDGEAIGAKVLRHPSLAAARERLAVEVAEVLAAIHRITPKTKPSLPLPDRESDPVQIALLFVRAVLDRLPEPRPGFEIAYRWLVENRPERREITLVHGDFRTGNFMVSPGGLAGVLDWEFAHWGDPLDDLGWLCVRDWRFGVLDRPAGGFAKRADFHAAYSRASGREVDPAAVRFWEVLGNVRWGAAAVLQGERYGKGRTGDIEMLAIPVRAPEMEWEALRLIDRAT